VPDDAFLADVLQAVLDSDDNFYQEFFVDDNHLLCYRRFCERLTVTVSWRATRELIVQRHLLHTLFTGQDYLLTWHTLSARNAQVQRQMVAIINGWEFHNSRLYWYNHSLAGPWI